MWSSSNNVRFDADGFTRKRFLGFVRRLRSYIGGKSSRAETLSVLEEKVRSWHHMSDVEDDGDTRGL